MHTLGDVMAELEKKGSEKTRKTYARHGIPDNMFGVSVADLKVIAKKIKGEQDLALELYDTGNYDAQYLAGIVADGSQMSKKQLESWAKNACCGTISEYSVPGVVCESEHARDLAAKWIDAKKEAVASSGWCVYAGIVAITPDDELDQKEIKSLLDRVTKTIHDAANRVRYTMNGFVIAVGSYVEPLLSQAKAAAKKIGKVEVHMGDTACKVPLATQYIEKIESAGRVGKKRKTVKC